MILGSVDEALNAMLDAEADQILRAAGPPCWAKGRA
jgi:hypothetical protein